jgi:hypothetical protein
LVNNKWSIPKHREDEYIHYLNKRVNSRFHFLWNE